MRKPTFAIRHSPFASSSRASRSGQSLVEAMVALSVLTLGFLGMVSLLSRSLVLTRVVSDQATATYLAEEGIEVAKNLIDHDVWAHYANPAVTGWGTCFFSASSYADVELDYTTTDCSTLAEFSAGDSLFFDPVTDLYGYHLPASDDPVPTGFTREIKVTRGDYNGTEYAEIIVHSIVRWSTAGVGQSLDLEDHFFDWRPQ
jgi:Tfp pilus assembly protein PilV